MHYDVLIVGSGLTGLTVALNTVDSKSVGIVTKRSTEYGASSWAQGGVAAAIDSEDTVEAHLNDTITVGSGLTDPIVAKQIIDSGPAAIDWLINNGVSFTKQPSTGNTYHLNQEGGHSHRRVIHSKDATGKAIQESLIKKIQNKSNIRILDNHIAIDIITADKLGIEPNRALGVYVLDTLTKRVTTIGADNIVLATGGAAKVYTYTTNPDTSTGDGIAMGWRAGCSVVNMEFIQFHPTCLFHPKATSFLISEAVRGEGGVLRLPTGERFMDKHDKRAELAPRDVVARAIDYEMKKRGIQCVYLDITHKSESFLKTHFPTILEKCRTLGINISKDPIPVVPAAHYTCGGIKANAYGQTEIKGLYAAGETAYSGLHGANRLASNSLLECVVVGKNVASRINIERKSHEIELPEWDDSRVIDADEAIVITHNWQELRKFMWDYVGIVRTDKRLGRALNRILLLKEEIREYYSQFHVTPDLLELRNLVQTSELIVKSASIRQESRGLHFSLNYPNKGKQSLPTILKPEYQ